MDTGPSPRCLSAEAVRTDELSPLHPSRREAAIREAGDEHRSFPLTPVLYTGHDVKALVLLLQGFP